MWRLLNNNMGGIVTLLTVWVFSTIFFFVQLKSCKLNMYRNKTFYMKTITFISAIVKPLER